MPYSVFSAGFYLIVNVRSSIFVDGGYGKNKDVIFYNFLVDARVDVDYGVLSLTERAKYDRGNCRKATSAKYPSIH